MKLGIIGMGNMATAMVGGILRKGILSPDEIIASRRTAQELQKTKKELGIHVTTDNREAAKNADILVLAVKPQYLADVITGICDCVSEKTVILSLAAGKTIEYIENAFLSGRKDACSLKIVRCMPNTPAFVSEGCTGVCHNGRLSEIELEEVMKLLTSFGTADVVPEKLMDAVVGVSGSAPAYVFIFIEAMADAGVLAGMPRAQAYRFAAQAVLGSAKMVLESGKHPGELKDMVCSPGGTTIEAVKVLEECGFRASVIDAVEACIEKSKSL